jgi:hypothetical protein
MSSGRVSLDIVAEPNQGPAPEQGPQSEPVPDVPDDLQSQGSNKQDESREIHRNEPALESRSKLGQSEAGESYNIDGENIPLNNSEYGKRDEIQGTEGEPGHGKELELSPEPKSERVNHQQDTQPIGSLSEPKQKPELEAETVSYKLRSQDDSGTVQEEILYDEKDDIRLHKTTPEFGSGMEPKVKKNPVRGSEYGAGFKGFHAFGEVNGGIEGGEQYGIRAVGVVPKSKLEHLNEPGLTSKNIPTHEVYSDLGTRIYIRMAIAVFMIED